MRGWATFRIAGHLHRDQQEVRLPLTPGNVLRGVVARLSKSPRIEKPQQRHLGRHVVEPCRSRAGLKPFPNLRVLVARESRDNRSLARPRLAKEPHDGRDRLCTLAGILRVGGRPGHFAELNLADGLPEPVEKSHDFSFLSYTVRSSGWLRGFATEH
jgi:hypothetical protein